MMRKTLCAIALAVSAGSPALADRAYDGCANKGSSNADFSACGSAWIAREEARLNRNWRSAYAGLPPASKRDLLAEQRAWIAYKDKSCRWRANGDWGREGQVIAYPTCRAKVVGDRADYLALILKDQADR